MRKFTFVLKQVVKQAVTVEATTIKAAKKKIEMAPILDNMIDPEYQESYKSAVTYGKAEVEPAKICMPISWRKARSNINSKKR